MLVYLDIGAAFQRECVAAAIYADSYCACIDEGQRVTTWCFGLETVGVSFVIIARAHKNRER